MHTYNCFRKSIISISPCVSSLISTIVRLEEVFLVGVFLVTWLHVTLGPNFASSQLEKMVATNAIKANKANVTVLSRCASKIVKMPPKLRIRLPANEPPINIKVEYRQRKSEMVAGMLFELWDTDPSEYNIEKIIDAKWKRNIHPLVQQGLEKSRAYCDVHNMFY